MGGYDYTTLYQGMKGKVYENYGNEHLCGNCKKLTSCVRNVIQVTNDVSRKRKLILKYAPFIRNFAVESMKRSHHEVGFVAVYECDKFEFDMRRS